MRGKFRTAPVTTRSSEASVEDEIAHLRDLDLRGLRARWQSVFQRPAPLHLPRHLLFAVLAFGIQADRFGELDHETRKVLDRTNANDGEQAEEPGPEADDRPIYRRFDLSLGPIFWRGRRLSRFQ